MAKILVADDNSNIQKMVGLALRDQGIEVVAVGNGEAAVRKIADIRPDLVLADVFMPVRNGYEVCEYVKTDSKLAHIPVILLVGAFDPLDEQEAQRVGADGVLKKPFVPPDPLISMVKSALLRAGVSLVPQAAAAPAIPAAPALPKLMSFGAQIDDLPGKPLASIPMALGNDESSNDLVPHRSAPVNIPEENQPLAFGNLLGTHEPQSRRPENETDPNFLVARHPELDEERSWNSAPAPEAIEEEAAEEPRNSWRRDAENEELEAGAATNGTRDWRETVMAALPASVQRELEPGRKVKESVAQAKAAPAEIDLEAAPVAAVPAEVSAGGSWGDPSPAATAETHVVTERAHEPVHAADSVAAGTGTPPWFSVPTNPWDAKIQEAQRLSETWNAIEPIAPAAASRAAHVPEFEMSSAPVYAAEPAPVETTPPAPQEKATVEMTSEPAHPTPQEQMESLVAKVLEKISPDMLQAMTREILKPVVEAIVKGEMDSKKS